MDAEDPTTRIARLEAENAALRQDAARTAVVGSRWRAPASAILIVLGLILGSLSTVSSYARDLLTDTNQFVATLAPLATDPAVQAVLVQATNEVIDRNVDIPALTADVFDGLRSLDLPPRASAALGLLQTPVTLGAQNLVRSMVENVITSPAFAQVWAQTLRVSHAQALSALRGDADAAVVAGADGTLRLQLGPILEAVRTRLLDQGITFARAVPTTGVSIVLAESAAMGRAVVAYGVVVTVAAWLPWVALLLLLAGVLVARRQRRALVATATAAVVGMGVLLAAIGIARAVGVGALAAHGTVITPAAAGSVFEQLTAPLTQRILVLGLIAAVIAVCGWIFGAAWFAPGVRAIRDRIATGLRRR